MKLAIFFFVTSSLLVILYSYIDNTIFNKQLNELAYTNITSKILERENFTNNTLNSSKKTLYSLRKNELFKNYLKNPKNSQKQLEYLFENIISSNQSIMQLRYIDEKGDEKIRFDRLNKETTNYKKEKLLQNKYNRYYFQDSITKKEEVYFSSFDLNIDKGKVQKPFNPTYRAILPIRDNNNFRGILIINYFGDHLTDQLFEMPLYDAILVDSDGYIIKHYNQLKNWSRYQDVIFTIEPQFQNVLHYDTYKTDNFVSKKLQLPFYNQLILILKIDDTYAQKQKELYEYRADIVLGVLVFALFILSIIIYLVFKHLEKQDLSIKFLTKEMQEQDKLLIQSSKMAAMGEMIANIAHQWKQPLSVISFHIIKIQRKRKNNELDDNSIEKFIEKVTSSVEHMSNTIEDFSNFFNPTKEKEYFSINQLINESLEIISSNLETNNIKINFDSNNEQKIFGYKSELKQVLFNILSNSQDAIQMNNISDGVINIRIGYNDSSVVIAFWDNGGGIQEEILERIFEPYFTTKFKKDGTGIGLYMCKMIIEDHFNGTIKLENKETGTQCIVELPKE